MARRFPAAAVVWTTPRRRVALGVLYLGGGA